jgi:cytidyltransferase-like protein
MKIVVVTGGFDPLHSGHIEYFNAAKELGDKLIVGINSDAWLARKKGQPFMPIIERMAIIENLKLVDHCVIFNDNDGSSIEAIKNVKMMYPDAEIIFANGGDRTHLNIPEMSIKDPRLSFEFGVGGFNKSNSSSWILREWKQPKTLRQWGYYRILHDVPGTKVKELTVEPGKSLSLQRHKHRTEHWHISEGRCAVEQRMPNGYQLPIVELDTLSQIVIPMNDWHRLYNPFDVPCRIIEIQYGTECNEEDIERKE